MVARELSNTDPETEQNSLFTQGLDVIPDDRNSLLRRETSRPCVTARAWASWVESPIEPILLTCGGIESVAWHLKIVGRRSFGPNKTGPH